LQSTFGEHKPKIKIIIRPVKQTVCIANFKVKSLTGNESTRSQAS